MKINQLIININNKIALPSSLTLDNQNLSNLDDHDFLQLFEAIKESETLRELNLCNCAIDDELIPFICDIITNNRFLEYINLDNNGMSISAAEQVIAAWSQNTNIEMIHMRRNNLDTEEMNAVLIESKINTSYSLKHKFNEIIQEKATNLHPVLIPLYNAVQQSFDDFCQGNYVEKSRSIAIELFNNFDPKIEADDIFARLELIVRNLMYLELFRAYEHTISSLEKYYNSPETGLSNTTRTTQDSPISLNSSNIDITDNNGIKRTEISGSISISISTGFFSRRTPEMNNDPCSQSASLKRSNN